MKEDALVSLQLPLTFSTLLILLLGAPVPARSQDESTTREAYLSALDLRTQAAVVKALGRIAEGNTASGLTDLQQLLDDPALEGRLLRPTHTQQPGIYRVNLPAADELRRITATLPSALRRVYQDLFDERARAMRRQALADRNPRALWRCYERYPASSVALSSARDAADLFFAAGNTDRARRMWIEIRTVLESHEAEPAERVVGASGDEEGPAATPATGEWNEASGELTARPLTAAVIAEQLERTTPTTRPNAPPSLPLAPGAVRLVWSEETNASSYSSHRDGNIGYATEPLVLPNVVGVSHFAGVELFRRDSGRALGLLPHYPHNFDVQVVGKPDSTRSGDRYVEVSPEIRRFARGFDDGTILAQYVAWMNPQRGRGRRGGMQEVSVPRRSLALLQPPAVEEKSSGAKRSGAQPNVLWETHRHPDPRVRPLSFNGTPLVHEGTVYALGWKWSGYTDVFLCAFDRATGDLRFCTLIVSNQVELTRFGFMACEPVVGDLAIAGDSVYVNSNMGAAAAVNLGTGRLEWLTEYFPVRRARDMHFRRYSMRFPYHPDVFWRPRAPLVVGDRVFFCPQDSPQLIACDRTTGAVVDSAEVSTFSDNELVGLWREFLVFTDGNSVHLLRPENFNAEAPSIALGERILGRPALYDKGVVYLTVEGLTALELSETGASRRLDLTSDKESRPHTDDRRPVITILEREILITTPYRVYCYRGDTL